MALNVWTQPSGYSLGTFPELDQINSQLPVHNDNGVSYTVISGLLPAGVFIVGNRLVGSPQVTKNTKDYVFCIRASNGSSFADRSFKLSINDIAQPEFLTPAGNLAAGLHRQFYVLDGGYVNYQIEAVDLNPEVDQSLRYSIESGNGELPPGLTLSESGLISGHVGPVLISVSGQDHPFTRTYAFTVTVSDGINFNYRTFDIFVADPNTFRADSLMRDGLAGDFTSDSSYIQQPIWITGSDLGIIRANNYITIPIAVYDSKNTTYRLEATNKEVYAVAFQANPNDNMRLSNYITVTHLSGTPTPGQYVSLRDYVSGATLTKYRITHVSVLSNDIVRLTVSTPLEVDIDNGTPFYIGSLSKLPDQVIFDSVTGQVYGRIPYQPVITQQYSFTITALRSYRNSTETVDSSRTFTVTVLGDVTSEITWASNSDLGTLHANYPSAIGLVATSSLPNANINYVLTDGALPPGLTLNTDGELIGHVNQYYDAETGELGLLTFDDNTTTFDIGATTFDHTYTFSVQASDQYQYSANTKEFTLTIDTPNTVPYSNITAKPFLDLTQRSYWRAFINNTNVFVADAVFRPSDTNFGIQRDLSMLIYAGIETKSAATYATSMTNGFKRKQFRFGEIKTAIALDPISRLQMYEVIYVTLYDPLEPNGQHLTPQIQNEYYVNSISNWRSHLRTGVHTERNYLPLWMRTIQPGSKSEIGFIPAITICYCKNGMAETILKNIKNSDFDFKNIDYTIDRFIVDSVTDYVGDKYLAFNDNRNTI